MSLRAAIKADLVHSAALWGLTPQQAIPRALGKVLLYPRVRAVIIFRATHLMWQSRAMRPLALLLQNYAVRDSGGERHPAADIGPKLGLVHSNGVGVGDKTRIGANARIYQQVTIGDDGKHFGQPTIGDSAVLGAGGKVLGLVTLGTRVTVAANAVVMRDVPDDARARGVPARTDSTS